MSEDDFGPTGFSFKMTANLAGYVGDLTLTAETGRDLLRMVKALAAAGIEQPPRHPALIPASDVSAAQDVPPLCPVHARPMKPSKQPGTWFCSATLDDGTYCKEKRKAG